MFNFYLGDLQTNDDVFVDTFSSIRPKGTSLIVVRGKVKHNDLSDRKVYIEYKRPDDLKTVLIPFDYNCLLVWPCA